MGKKKTNKGNTRNDILTEMFSMYTQKKSYHEKWGEFTEKLYACMTRHRDLVVVIPFFCDLNSGALDCSVVNVYDHRTGEIYDEKIILIFDKKDNITDRVGDDYIDLPFE